MARLIDADNITFNQHEIKTMEMLAMIVDVIEKQPAVDAVPVIRCEDCSAFLPTVVEVVKGKPAVTKRNYCCMWEGNTSREGYCSKAERKKEQKDESQAG